MKKTLLIAAAALAAGIITSQAQPVYSQNVVGYVNQTIPALTYQIIGSQLINGSDAAKTNGDINATLINGLISSSNVDPSISSNSVMYAWNGIGYANYYYFNAADASTWETVPSPAGWYDLGGTPAAVNLNNGKAVFIYNHSTSPLTITTVGTVAQGTNYATINTGYNLIALQEPISTNLLVAGFGLPVNMTSSPLDPPTQTRNDTLYAWGGTGYFNYYYFNAADATTWQGTPSPAGFYTLAGVPMSAYPQVNQGFFLYHNGAPITWTNAYIVQ